MKNDDEKWKSGLKKFFEGVDVDIVGSKREREGGMKYLELVGRLVSCERRDEGSQFLHRVRLVNSSEGEEFTESWVLDELDTDEATGLRIGSRYRVVIEEIE